MLNPNCPIRQDKVHCPTCYFAPKGSCDYTRIIRERQQMSLNLQKQDMEQALSKLTERHK